MRTLSVPYLQLSERERLIAATLNQWVLITSKPIGSKRLTCCASLLTNYESVCTALISESAIGTVRVLSHRMQIRRTILSEQWRLRPTPLGKRLVLPMREGALHAYYSGEYVDLYTRWTLIRHTPTPFGSYQTSLLESGHGWNLQPALPNLGSTTFGLFLTHPTVRSRSGQVPYFIETRWETFPFPGY